MEKGTKWLIFKATLILVMLGLMFFKEINEQLITIAISMIMVMILITFLRFKYPEKYKKDERLEKLSAYAVSWSWTVSLMIVTFVYWLNYLDYISLTADQIITIIFLTMVITIVLFRIYFMRKADIR